MRRRQFYSWHSFLCPVYGICLWFQVVDEISLLLTLFLLFCTLPYLWWIFLFLCRFQWPLMFTVNGDAAYGREVCLKLMLLLVSLVSQFNVLFVILSVMANLFSLSLKSHPCIYNWGNLILHDLGVLQSKTARSRNLTCTKQIITLCCYLVWLSNRPPAIK